MTDPLLTAVAFVLLVGGVAGSLLPGVPGAVLTVAGTGLYWWASGFTEPATPLALALLAVGLAAVVADWVAGPLAAHVGGAGTRTVLVAGLVGVLALVFAGPLVALLSVPVTVFALEWNRHGQVRTGARMAAVTTLGVLGGTAVQVVLTATVLVVMLVVVFV